MLPWLTEQLIADIWSSPLPLSLAGLAAIHFSRPLIYHKASISIVTLSLSQPRKSLRNGQSKI